MNRLAAEAAETSTDTRLYVVPQVEDRCVAAEVKFACSWTPLPKPLDPYKDAPLSAYVVAAAGTPHDHATCWGFPGVS